MIKKTCVIFMLILLINQTIALRNSGKKIMINSNTWASEWFQKNKNEFKTNFVGQRLFVCTCTVEEAVTGWLEAIIIPHPRILGM